MCHDICGHRIEEVVPPYPRVGIGFQRNCSPCRRYDAIVVLAQVLANRAACRASMYRDGILPVHCNMLRLEGTYLGQGEWYHGR
jgi:hypothetical protein